ncbi:MAG: NAD(P)/FAD-dependent oxidoreductase [Aestuariivirga sp.]|uniref:NAD(P)/FAD-dependent oxidoreductase n=1 Tax=Aestuariivirga sp. TaxID=2650926 RepID=UPI0038D1E65D
MAEIRVFGAGPSGLMAAEVLASAGHRVTIHDHMAAPARKFLLAGRGGLNLTHSEPLETLLGRYGDARRFLETAIRAFPPDALIDWANGLGIETFIGTSGRVFPRQMKASPLLRAWLKRLAGLGVTLHTRSSWTGFDSGPAILALGGASWPHLGSDAAWVPAFRERGIAVTPFQPSNSRFAVNWSPVFAAKFAGQPLKNIALSYGQQRVRGELMISREGIEGGAIYALSRHLRDNPGQPLLIDLRPDLSADALAAKLARPRGKDSLSTFLRKAVRLSPPAIGLLRETGTQPDEKGIKSLAVTLGPPMGLERAISSAGGVARTEFDTHFQLIKAPGIYCVGEMLDWEAPTGGYLLQACFSTAVWAAQHLASILEKR